MVSMAIWAVAVAVVAAAGAETLPGTDPLTQEGDLAAAMVAGIDAYLDRALAECVEDRARHWPADGRDSAVEANRDRLRTILGIVDARRPAALELVATLDSPALLAEAAGYRVFEVRWPVLEGVWGEGLLLEPESPRAWAVALPDCDTTPEALAGLDPGVPEAARFACRLAEAGCRVVIPVLVDRRDTWSGAPEVRMTNQPHREYVYRPAYQMGRHVIGYEVQKVLACVDAFAAGRHGSVGVMGYGEGGLVAFYAAAVDPRIAAAAVSGYFGPREALWSEPVYRNVWGLLERFGDAEVSALVAPRTLVVEAARGPDVAGPPPETSGRRGAAPGVIGTPSLESVRREVDRARAFVEGWAGPVLVEAGDGLPGQEPTLRAFLAALGLEPGAAADAPARRRPSGDADVRMARQVGEILEHTQRLVRESPKARDRFWADYDPSSVESARSTAEAYRGSLWDHVLGRFPEPHGPARPRTRLFCDEPAYRGYEAMLDVYPEVFAYGLLLVPKDLAPGERRPVVVCQHGLEGRPQDLADPRAEESPYYHYYGCRLAERGYVVYAPQNPYIGGDDFRRLQRKANPLGRSLFGIIARQHQRTLDWLAGLPFVDPERIAFYGLSYGGKTAMRVPAVLPGYCLVICSGDFNEWIWKTTSIDSPYSYQFTGEYEMYEFDLGHTFNYGELARLIFPRPFMVERGHRDGVAPDEWVAYEYARVRRLYEELGLGDRTAIEYFNGPHEIHGVGTFDFLDRQLRHNPDHG